MNLTKHKEMKYFFTGLQMTLDIILSESNLEYSFQEYLVDKCSSKKEKKRFCEMSLKNR